MDSFWWLGKTMQKQAPSYQVLEAVPWLFYEAHQFGLFLCARLCKLEHKGDCLAVDATHNALQRAFLLLEQ
jgi:hypothetical protein